MEDLGKSFPLAESMVDAEQGTDKKLNNEFCLNCGEKLVYTYCHHCGQKDLPRRQTMGELIENFIGSFYSFESKFFRTIKFLLFKPGFLPVEYTAGKRESDYHPARAYVFISFIFFLLLFSLPDIEDKKKNRVLIQEDKKEFREGMKQIKEELNESGIDSSKADSIYNTSLAADTTDIINSLGPEKKINAKKKKNGISLMDSEYKSIKEYDSAQQALPASERHGWLMKKLHIRGIELNQRYQGDDAGNRFTDDFKKAFLENFSKVLFYLLPIFALLLKLLYVRRDYYYSEHLVFSIYYYNFFYLAASFYLLFDYIPFVGGLLTSAMVIWALVYLPLGMKRMYQQSWRKTILKYSIFLFAFFVCLMIGITGSMLAILMYL